EGTAMTNPPCVVLSAAKDLHLQPRNSRCRSFASLRTTTFLLLVASAHVELRAQAYDIVIRNGRVLDGAGNPWINADVAIRDGRFVKIGVVRERGRVE